MSKLTIESYEIITQLLVTEINNAESEEDAQQAQNALDEVDAIGTY